MKIIKFNLEEVKPILRNNRFTNKELVKIFGFSRNTIYKYFQASIVEYKYHAYDSYVYDGNSIINILKGMK